MDDLKFGSSLRLPQKLKPV